MPAPSRPAARPLVVTADEHLLDEVLRLAAAASVDVEVVPEAGLAMSRWPGAPLVIVGGDVAASLAAMSPPRRAGVVVVDPDLDVAEVWRQGVALGADRVVALPDAEAWLVDRLCDVAEGGRGHSVVVGVVGGCGGAGASVLATALAMTAAKRDGLNVMLIDADPLGGGLDLALGAESAGGLRWPDLIQTRGRLAGATLREHLPEPHGVTLLSWDRGDVLTVPAEAARAVVGAARRSWDLVVVDLPRNLDTAAAELLACCGCVLLVVPKELRAAASAGRMVARLTPVSTDLRLVVRRRRPGGLRADELSDLLGLPLAMDIKSESGLPALLDQGKPPGRDGGGALARACQGLLTSLLIDRQELA